jgi:hypothetical protein
MSAAEPQSGLVQWSPAFDNAEAVTYATDANFRLIRTNLAWDRFATLNGAPELVGQNAHGTCLLDVIPQALQAFYKWQFEQVIQHGSQRSHILECSSAGSFRRLHMRMLPFEGKGLLIVNSLVAGVPQTPLPAGEVHEYVDTSGIVTICSHCRRVKHRVRSERWDWAPNLWDGNSYKISHGLCSVCRIHHYPEWANRKDLPRSE